MPFIEAFQLDDVKIVTLSIGDNMYELSIEQAMILVSSVSTVVTNAMVNKEIEIKEVL